MCTDLKHTAMWIVIWEQDRKLHKNRFNSWTIATKETQSYDAYNATFSFMLLNFVLFAYNLLLSGLQMLIIGKNKKYIHRLFPYRNYCHCRPTLFCAASSYDTYDKKQMQIAA